MVVDREAYFDRWSALHGGYDPRGSTLVRLWLGWTYALARPLAAARVPPDVVTLLGLLVGGAVVWLCALGGRWALLAVVVVVASGLLDNLDGAVAVLADRTSRWGYVLDSVVDRLTDASYVVALWLLGAPGWLCVVGGALMGLQEYARARAGAAGLDEVGVVTVWERPTRVIVTAMFVLGAGWYVGSAAMWALAGAAAWATLGAVGCAQLTVALRRLLD